MSHICSAMSTEFDTLVSNTYNCGSCGEKFSTICTLHQHITGHNESGSYHYDDIMKVAIPKLDYCCSGTQTDLVQKNIHQPLEIFKKYEPAAENNFKDITEQDEADVNVNNSMETNNRTNKDSCHLDGKLDQDDLIAKYVKKRNTRSFVRDKSDLIQRTSPARRHSDKKSRTEVFEYNSIIVTTAVKPCSVSLQRLSEKDLMFAESYKKESRDLNFKGNNRLENTVTDSTFTTRRVMSQVRNIDHGDEVANGDNLFSLSLKNIGYRSSNKTESHELIKDSAFKVPVTVSKHRRTRKGAQTSKCGIINQKLPLFDKNKNDNLETREDISIFDTKVFSTEKQKVRIENLNEKNSNGGEERDLEIIHEKEYFYGKISVGEFEIQRMKPSGVFNKGEKNEFNKVFVDDTWKPISEWTNDSYMTTGSTAEEEEFAKSQELNISDNDDKILSNKDVKLLKRKWKYQQGQLLVCNMCGKSFKHSGHFKGHMNVHFGLKPYLCQYCGKSYHKITALQTHQLHVHSDKDMWMTCQVCGAKSFPTAARLKAHEETHATEYNYMCHECNKSYKSAKLLKDHVKYAHSKKKFRCNNCKQSFASVEERKTHQQAKHDGVNKCRFCSREFTCLRSKVRHEKIHLGIKPHECHICLRRFLQKHPYWVHMDKYHDLTKIDLIQLFPEKHLDKNKQHLLQKKPVDKLNCPRTKAASF